MFRTIPLALFCASLLAWPALAGDDLTLARALQRALASPELATATAEIDAARGREWQAGLLPNPEASATVENFAGSRTYRGTRAAETTLQLSQLIELGGKRAARSQAASRETDLVRADLAVARLEIAVRTQAAFVNVLAAQQRLGVIEERLSAAAKLLPAVERRIQAGASPTADLARGRIAVDLVRADRERAGAELDTARRELASQFGLTAPDFGRVAGTLAPPRTGGIDLAALTRRLEQNPQLARWETVEAQRRAALALQQARAVPDVRVGVGARRFHETSATALVFSVALPIPVFDRNQGEILAAVHTLGKTASERQAARLALFRKLNESWGRMEAARHEFELLDRSTLPVARRTLGDVQAGYEQGRFGVLDLLDARASLSDIHGRRIDALAAWNRAAAEIEGLTNRSLDAASNAEGSK